MEILQTLLVFVVFGAIGYGLYRFRKTRKSGEKFFGGLLGGGGSSNNARPRIK